MITTSLQTDTSDYAQYATWLITIVLVAVGFRYAKEVIAFVLDKLYEFFIEKNLLR